MNELSKVQQKFRQTGMRGVIASALRHSANRLEHHAPTSEAENVDDKEFLTWVRFAVPGMLGTGNILSMEYAISHMPKGASVLEIGSFCGLSTVVLRYFLDKYSPSSVMYTSDKWEFEGQQIGKRLGASSVTHEAYKAYVKGSYVRNMQTFAANNLPHTVECFSDEFFSRWFANEHTVDVFNRPVTLGGQIGFSYIDGNHTYDFAKRDFENTNRILLSGGFILFDDSDNGTHWEVNQLVREIAAGNEYELISHNPNYLFRKI